MRYTKNILLIIIFNILIPWNISSYANNISYEDDFESEYQDIVPQISDPFEKINRKIFSLNIFLLDNVATPVIKGYRFIIPKFVRDRIFNMKERISDVSTLINSILELDFLNTGKTLATFTTNMTIGCFGLFNPAQKFGYYRDRRTFGDTLGYYGIGTGIYLMIPFAGPTTIRDGFGQVTMLYINPLDYNLFEIGGKRKLFHTDIYTTKYLLQYTNDIDKAVSLNDKFLKKSFDPYIFTRDSYIQNRQFEIKKIKKQEKE